MRPSFLLVAGILTAATPLHLTAADRFWDINGAVAGAGGPSPSGAWNATTPNWNLSLDGTGAPVIWDPVDTAVFSAGSDATGAYTVTISGNQIAAGVTVEEGTVSFRSGAASVGTGVIAISAGAALSIDSSLRLVGTAGSKVALNGGTLINTNPANAGSFLSANINIEVGALGGTVDYSSSGIGAVALYGVATDVPGGTITGTGTLTKTGFGEFRYQGFGLTRTTFTKLVVNQGLFRLGFSGSISDERGFGAVPASFTADAITLSGGGTIGTSFTAANSVLHVNRGITLGAGGGQLLGPITVPGAITGSGGLTATASTVALTGANNFTGSTTAGAGTTIALGSATVASGSLLSTSVINANNGTLSLINTAGIENRVGDATPIVLRVGAVSLTANASTDTTEAVGVVTLESGVNTISVGSAAGRVTTLMPASIARGTQNATALVRGTSLAQTVATNVARITLGDGGASLGLVGTNTLDNAATSDATPAVRIVPHFFGDTSSTGTGNGFVTYDATLGLRVLTAAQTTPLTAGYTTAANPDNASVTATTTLDGLAPITVNSLLFSGAAASVLDTASPTTLTVNSGAVATTGAFDYTVGGSFSGLNLGNGEGVITVTANSLTVGSPISVTNGGGLTKAGTGTLNLNVGNAYTGPTTIAGGVVVAGTADSLGANTVRINGTRLSVAAGVTLANPIIIGANTGVAGRGLIEPAAGGVATITGPITINNNAVGGGHFAATGAGAALIVAGEITAPPAVTITTRLGNVTFSGGGAGYTNLQIQGGTVSLGADNGLAVTALVDVASSEVGTLDLKGFNQTLAGLLRTSNTANRNALVTNSIPILKTLTLDVSGQVAFAGTVAAAATGAFGEAVISGALSLVKNGVGTQALSGGGASALLGGNTYTGSTTINAGILKLQKANNVDAIPAGNDVFINPGGTLQLGQSSQINDGVFGFFLNGGVFDLGAFIEGITPAVTITNGTIAGTSAGYLLARGGFNASGTNTISKSVTVRGADLDSGRFDVFEGTTTVSGAIQSDDGTVQGITKVGPGTLVLSGASTYTGPTLVTGGAVIVSGSLSANSDVTVGDSINVRGDALLGGSGSVGNVSAAGPGDPLNGVRIAPGNSTSAAGILRTGAFSLTSGAHLTVQIGGPTAGGEATTGYDQVIAAGAVSLTGGDLELTLAGNPTFANGDRLFLIINNGGALLSSVFDTVNGASYDAANIVIGGRQFELSYAENFAGPGITDGLANDVALIAIIPEPSALLALLGGMGTLLGLRRLRARR